MNIFVIFLRGIAPTDKNKVPMAPLREALTEAALGEVRTYIQSGNVIGTSEFTHVEVENSCMTLSSMSSRRRYQTFQSYSTRSVVLDIEKQTQDNTCFVAKKLAGYE